jgi:hypothetical protein
VPRRVRSCAAACVILAGYNETRFSKNVISEWSANRKLRSALDKFRLARHPGGIANVTAIGGRRLMIPKYYLGTVSCLLRKYIWGVVPSIFRNISIKALTLS